MLGLAFQFQNSGIRSFWGLTKIGALLKSKGELLFKEEKGKHLS